MLNNSFGYITFYFLSINKKCVYIITYININNNYTYLNQANWFLLFPLYFSILP